jgi:polyhydroxybutyrate depolymerase
MRRLWLLGILLLLTACSGGQASDPEAGTPTKSATGSATATESEAEPSTSVTIGPGDQRVEFTLPDGTESGYLLHAPASFGSDSQLALVLVFHGSPGSPQEMVHATGFNAIADEENFLVVYPEAIDESGDVGALIDDVTHRVAVDLAQVYATGFSRGASITYLLASELADRIAAFAPVSGVSYHLPPGDPTSLVAFQGTEDPAASAFPEVNSRWSDEARCGRPDVTTLTLAGRPTQRTAAECRSGTDHVVYRVQGMGHEWPRGASRLIWEFFSSHPLDR